MADAADTRYDRLSDMAVVKGSRMTRKTLQQAVGIALSVFAVTVPFGSALAQARQATTGKLTMTGAGPTSPTPFVAKETTTGKLTMTGAGPVSPAPFAAKTTTTGKLTMTGALLPK